MFLTLKVNCFFPHSSGSYHDLQKNQLTEKLGTNLTEDIAALDLAKVVKLASSLLNDVKVAADDVQGQHCQVLSIVPSLERFNPQTSLFFSQIPKVTIDMRSFSDFDSLYKVLSVLMVL